MPDSVANPIQGCPKKGSVPQPKNDSHFINFKLVDTDGAPVKHVVVHIIFPDGSAEERTSDHAGMVELKHVKAGVYKVDYDWKGVKMDDAVLIQS